MSNLKMYAIVSAEALDAIKGNRGKLAAQTGHAFLHAYWDCEKSCWGRAIEYRNSNSATKVVLIVDSTEELIEIWKEYKQNPMIGTTLVKDAGKTVFKEPTITCVGIGPIKEEECSDTLKSLKVFI